MSDEIKDAVEDLNRTWESELKPRIEQMEREQKSSGTAHTETRAAVDRVNDRLDSIESLMQKASLVRGAKEGESSQEIKDMIEFVRSSHISNQESKVLSAKSSVEHKVLAIRDESLGGVLAPPDFIAEVVKGIIQFSPIRQIATVRQTSRTSIQYPKRTGNFAAQWTAEQQARSETTGRTYGLDEIPTHELYARVLISNWDLEDPVVNLEDIITQDMVDQFAKAEGTAFVSGTGVGKPEGILADADVQSSAVLNGGASFTNGDAIIKLAMSVKEQYWPNARYVMSRLSLRDLRVLKDSQGNYLWQPTADGYHGLSTGLPATLYGYPYTIAVDYPSAAANAYTVTFGDHSLAYWVVDRVEMQLLRDPFSQASAGAVVLHARKRVGGQVVLPEAIAALQMA